MNGLKQAITTPGTGAHKRLNEMLSQQAQMADQLRAEPPRVGGSDQQTTMAYNLPPRQQATPPTPMQPQPIAPPTAPPAQPPAQAPAQAPVPTNRQLIDSLRGLSKGDEKWFGQLFSDPQNAGLGGQSNWSTTDPAQLRQSISEGGLNPQNQQRLISALRMGRPGFQEPPPLQAQPGTNQGIRYGR